MATTSNTYTGNGSNKLFSITFPYLDESDIDVYLNGTLQTITTHYFFANATTIEFVTAPSNGAVVLLDRTTDDSALQATFFSGSTIRSSDLNDNFDQVLFIAQETTNDAAGATAASAAATATANAAASTAGTAATNASNALSTANTAATNASNAVSTANSANTTANNATTTANNAVTTANQAVTAVASVVPYTKVAAVANIPATPTNNQTIEVANSTGIESFSPLSNIPAGYVGSTGLSVRIIYSTSATSWNFVEYFANDPENRYLKLAGGTVTGEILIGSAGSLVFEGATDDTFETTLAVADATADRTLTLPNVTGTLVSTGDTGTVTSTMIADDTIVNADINASAAIVDTKLATIATGGKVSGTAITSGNISTSGSFTSTSTVTGTNLIPTGSGVPTNGIYLPAANSVAVATNGTGRLFINNGGDIGVGTASPVSRLHVTGGDSVFGSGNLTRILNASQVIDFTNAAQDTYVAGRLNGLNLKFYTNAGSGIDITSAGLVGIGTSAPGNTLHVNSGNIGLGKYSDQAAATRFVGITGTSGFESVFTAGLGITTTVANQSQDVFLQSHNFGVGYNSLILKADGKVGIGSTAPSAQLHVRDSANYNFTVAAGNSTTGMQIGNYDATDGYNPLTFRGSQYLFISTGGNERARIDASGRLLVGTSSARTYTTGGAGGNHKLQLETAGATSVFTTAGIYSNSDVAGIGAYLELGRSKGTALGAVTAVALNDILGEIRFAGTNGTAANSAASIAGYVDGAVSGGGANDMPGRLVFSTTADGASAPTTRLTIASNGDFRVVNTGFFHPVTDNAVSLGLSGFRWSAVWAANGTIQTSDERAKADITNATLGSDFIKALRPVSYRWIEGGKRDTGERDEDNNYIYESVSGTRTHWGFIAQEVKQAVDDAGVDFGGWVLTDKDDPDSQQALRYDQFIAPLTKALQEALEKIETLEAKVAALETP